MNARKILAVPAVALIGLSFAAPAFAWKHVDPPYAWKPDDLPIQYYVAPAADCEETVVDADPGYCVRVIQEAHEAWQIGAPCADLGGGEYLGDYPGYPQNHGFDLNDGLNSVGFNDPNAELEVGVLGANLTKRFANAFTLNGQTYRWADNSDIVFNNDVDFATHEEIANGQCQGRTNMRAVATHEVGHLYGMGHSCDEFEVCTDRDLLEAVMYWTSAACEELITLQKDDIEGINTLYGPSATFACSHQLSDDLAIGVVPFEMKCVVESAEYLQEVQSATWSFGNGKTAEGINVTNVYEEPGNYTVEINVTGERDVCVSEENPGGEWSSTFRKVGFVRACGLPDVSFSAKHVDGLTWQTVNDSDVSVYGCIQDIEWNVYAGDSATGEPIADLTKKAWEPQITFPDEGTYTILVNVGGPAGTSAAQLTVEVQDKRGEGRGCSNTGSVGFGSAGLVLLAFGLVGQRRRSR